MSPSAIDSNIVLLIILLFVEFLWLVNTVACLPTTFAVWRHAS